MTITLHQNDLPDGLDLGPVVAIDTETMGRQPHSDRLRLVQHSAGDGNAHLVQIAKGQRKAPNLARLVRDRKTLKLFHFGRFDIAVLAQEALELMNSHKITCLFVTEGDAPARPLGILHLHDCLRAGIDGAADGA